MKALAETVHPLGDRTGYRRYDNALNVYGDQISTFANETIRKNPLQLALYFLERKINRPLRVAGGYTEVACEMAYISFAARIVARLGAGPWIFHEKFDPLIGLTDHQIEDLWQINFADVAVSAVSMALVFNLNTLAMMGENIDQYPSIPALLDRAVKDLDRHEDEMFKLVNYHDATEDPEKRRLCNLYNKSVQPNLRRFYGLANNEYRFRKVLPVSLIDIEPEMS